jgi:hypothetical protein
MARARISGAVIVGSEEMIFAQDVTGLSAGLKSSFYRRAAIDEGTAA